MTVSRSSVLAMSVFCVNTLDGLDMQGTLYFGDLVVKCFYKFVSGEEFEANC